MKNHLQIRGIVDSLQLLVEENHGVFRHPEWSNTTDFKDTTEQFGTVSLQSDRSTHDSGEIVKQN